MTQPIARCAIRVSLVRDEKQSPKTQRDDMMRWCKRNGYKPVFYVDAEGYRSGRTDKRPDFQRLLEDIEEKPTHAIVFWDVSRLARNNELSQWFYNTCKNRKIRLAFVRNGLDFDFDRADPFMLATSKLLFDILAGTAEYYSNELSARVRANVERLRTVENRHFGGTIPFGCDRIDGKLVPTESGCWWRVGTTEWVESYFDEEQGEWVPYGEDNPPEPERPGAWKWRGYYDALRRAYELYATGAYGFARVAGILTAEGYAYRGLRNVVRMFNPKDVSRLIAMHLQYAGHLTRGYSSAPYRDGGAEIIAYNVWEPILPPDLIQQAAAVQQARARRHSRIKSRHRVYELQGLLYCASCGQRLRGNTRSKPSDRDKTKRLLYFRYSHISKNGICDAIAYSIDAEQAEEIVLEYVSQHFDFSLMRDEIASIDAQTALMSQSKDESLAARLIELQQRRQKLIDEWLSPDTILTRDDFHTRIVHLDSEIRKLEEAQKQAKSEHIPLIIPASFMDVLALADPEERREFYRLIIKKIIYDVDEHRIRIVPRQWAAPYFSA